MSEYRKFPNGYDVEVVRREDVIPLLETSDEDKAVIDSIIEQLELNIYKHLEVGDWTGIPFLGSIKVPEIVQVSSTPEFKGLLNEAKETMSSVEYNKFADNLFRDANERVYYTRVYLYKLSMFVTKNRHFYSNLCKFKGTRMAKVICYSLIDCETSFNGEF